MKQNMLKFNWQKNWVGFDWHGQLLIDYYPHPHEVLWPNMATGECYSLYKTSTKIEWPWGELRGGTPPLLVDGEYLTFFHSAILTASMASNEEIMWHYYMGALTSHRPPLPTHSH